MTTTSAKHRRPIKKGKQEKKGIKEYILRIWNNIQILRIVSTIGTVLSLALAYPQVNLIIDNYRTKNLIKKLENTSLELNKEDKEFCRNWLKDVELLKNKSHSKEEYLYLKGLGLTMIYYKDSLYNTELPPNYYLSRIDPGSTHYNDAVIFRSMDIMKHSHDSLIRYKLGELIEEMEKNQILNPRYYYIKYLYAHATHELNKLLNSYNEFKHRYVTVEDGGNKYVRDVINANDDKKFDLMEVQTLNYLYSIEIVKAISYILNYKTITEEEFSTFKSIGIERLEYLGAINSFTNNKLGFLRVGLAGFQSTDPLFPPGLHLKLYFDNNKWFNSQHKYLFDFISCYKDSLLY